MEHLTSKRSAQQHSQIKSVAVENHSGIVQVNVLYYALGFVFSTYNLPPVCKYFYTPWIYVLMGILQSLWL